MRVKARCLALLLAYFVCRNVFLLCGGRLRVNFYAPRVCAAQVCFTDVHTHMCAHSVVCLSDYDCIFIFFTIFLLIIFKKCRLSGRHFLRSQYNIFLIIGINFLFK